MPLWLAATGTFVIAFAGATYILKGHTRMTSEMMARLRRSLAQKAQGAEVSSVLAMIESAVVDKLSEQHAALFESVLEPYVIAAEQLGDDATMPDVAALAKILAERKN